MKKSDTMEFDEESKDDLVKNYQEVVNDME